MSKKRKIRKVTLFINGKVSVINTAGYPIPELEGRYTADLHKKLVQHADSSTIWENFPDGFNPILEEEVSIIPKFEYLAEMTIDAEDHEELSKKLTELGNKGWELIQFEVLMLMGAVKVRMFNPVFKRQI